MSLPEKKLSKNSQDIRLKATQQIWFFAIGMLAICIPLATVTNSGSILPIAVIVGTSLATVSIWRVPQEKSNNKGQVLQTIKKLEERITNLEIIVTSENINWQSSNKLSPKNEILLTKDSSSITELEKSEQTQEINSDQE